MYSSAIVFVVCARRKNRRNSKLECRRSARQDLYRPPRLPSAACGWRLGTVAVRRRLHAPPDKETAARHPETQDAAVGMRDANGRALLEALQGVLQAGFSTICSAWTSLSVTRMRSLRPLRRDSANGEPSEVSSALPGQRNEADVLVGRIGTDSTSRRPSVSSVSVANAVEGTFCAV